MEGYQRFYRVEGYYSDGYILPMLWQYNAILQLYISGECGYSDVDETCEVIKHYLIL